MKMKKKQNEPISDMGFKIISKGKQGIICERESTGKKISIVGANCSFDCIRLWTNFKIHPFMVHQVNGKIKFRDMLTMEDLDSI